MVGSSCISRKIGLILITLLAIGVGLIVNAERADAGGSVVFLLSFIPYANKIRAHGRADATRMR